MYIREKYIAGETIIYRERMKRIVEKGKKRAPKSQPTSEKVWQNNLRYSIFKLTLILNANFKPGDLLLLLTYENEPEKEKAAVYLRNFFRSVQRKCKKEGIDFKRVAVTERRGTRLHHHIVCNNIPMRIIKESWPHGRIFHKPLWDYPNYADLASYLLKQAAKLYMEDGDISKKRYTTSRNIVIPEGIEVEVNRGDIEAEPKPLKGYQIDEDSVQIYENEITGSICREYIMVSTNETPRIKKWRPGITAKGEKVNYAKALREAYKEVQETIEDLIL